MHRLWRGLIFVLLICLLPTAAIAEKASVKLNYKYGFMYADGEATLKAKTKAVPLAELKWSSSDESVATVDGGRVKARSVGRTVITASGRGASGKCGVVVLPRELELEKGEKLSLPRAGVESYKSYDKSLVSVSKKGVITAKKAGQTRVRVAYGKQKLYIDITVGGGSVEESKAAKLSCADETSQIVLVEHESGSKATLSIHEKKDVRWTQLYSCRAYLGKNGIGKTKEGDKKTPSGTYNLTFPFGIKGDPGAQQDYLKVTKHHYWCGTSSSSYYNQLVDMRTVDRQYTSSDEYLIKYKGVYNYCMFIDYNADGEAGKGSCIFLHCTGSNKYTAGCIAVDEAVMKKIVQWAKPNAKIVIE